MGYFSNSTESAYYQARWCARCVHEDYDNGCTIMQLHFFEQDTLQDALGHFIPRGKKGQNKKCQMFMNRKKLKKKKKYRTE